MESTAVKKVRDPLLLLPDVPILEIARKHGVSDTPVLATIARLRVAVKVTPTGRKTVSPADAIRISEDLLAKLVR